MATAASPRGRPFVAGESGNSKGRPRGARNKINDTLARLLAADAVPILTTILTTAKNGDLQAGMWALSRLLPPAKDRPISFDLPAIDTAEGIAQAQAAIVAAVAAGHLLLTEATALSALVDAHRRAIETNELAVRIAALELKEAKV